MLPFGMKNCKHVTVVGNGPLSDDQRKSINESDCVVRFNDMKNRRFGDKTDVLALRENVLHLAQEEDVPILPILSRKDNLQKVDNFLSPIVIFEPQFKDDNILKDATLFENCSFARTHSEAYHGPSSGAAVIDFLEKNDYCESIHIYGMNWNSKIDHIDFKHDTLVKDCCTKCVLHPTHDRSY